MGKKRVFLRRYSAGGRAGIFRNVCAHADTRHDQRISLSLVTNAVRRSAYDAVNSTLCRGAGVKPGDIVDVVMERDEKERTVEAPPLLKKALAENNAAQANWEKLSFTHKKEMATCISEAKREETRVRRPAKVMQILKAGAKWTG
jgi:hypothetical protein